MNRKKILIIVGTVVLLVIGLITVLLTQNTPQTVPPRQVTQQNSHTIGTANVQSLPNAASPVPQNGLLTPEEVTGNFYRWYLTYAGSPLASGAFSANAFLTSGFKLQMTKIYQENPKEDPVICAQNRTLNIKILPAIYDISGKNAQVMIIDGSTSRYLQKVILKKNNATWYIDDIICEI